MPEFRLRAMEESERAEVAELVSVSMNTWDVVHGTPGRFYAGAPQTDGFWHISVHENERGGLDGFLASIGHPLFNEIGPGVARTEAQAAALLVSELNQYRGRMPLLLVPAECTEVVRLMYRLGGRNCEIHAALVRGEAQPFRGVSMPTFMPETG